MAETGEPDGKSARTLPPLHVGLVGDSTVFEYPPESPMRGWGQVLAEYLPGPVVLTNGAVCGASTRTFPAEKWNSLLALHPTYVLIQFGHNDSHAKENPESTDPATGYPQNLRRYVCEARAAGVVPVLVTPVRRRTYLDSGRVTEELAPYAAAMKGVAQELGVPLIDLHAASGVLFEELGESGTEAFTVNKTDTADRPGLGDRTHYTAAGARAIARLIAPRLLKVIFPDG